MKKSNLILAGRDAQELLVETLTDYVRENGEEMNDYFLNEFGLDGEIEDELEILKILDLSKKGCYYASQNNINDDNLSNFHYPCGTETQMKLMKGFHHYSFWALYLVRDTNGKEYLKYYMFFSEGVEFSDDAEADHDDVQTLGLIDLRNIIEAIIRD